MEAAVEACRRSGRVTGAECLFLRGCPFSVCERFSATVYGAIFGDDCVAILAPTSALAYSSQNGAHARAAISDHVVHKCSAARQPLRSHHHLQSGQIISTSRTYFWRLFSEPLNCAVGTRTKFRVPARRETGCTSPPRLLAAFARAARLSRLEGRHGRYASRTIGESRFIRISRRSVRRLHSRVAE